MSKPGTFRSLGDLRGAFAPPPPGGRATNQTPAVQGLKVIRKKKLDISPCPRHMTSGDLLRG